MRRLAAAGAMVVASVSSGHGQERVGDAAPRYAEVAVLEFKDGGDAPAWRLFALKSSPTTLTVAVFRDDADPVPAMQLALNATPPVPVQRVRPAYFEIEIAELANVLTRDALHAIYISVGDREHTVTLTESQRRTLLAHTRQISTDSFAEDTAANCSPGGESGGDGNPAARANLGRRLTHRRRRYDSAS